MSEVHDVLLRFHQVLVEEISEKRPEYLGGPFTVAEIYQNLVPYGTHRDRLGIEMNGDYEDALLRLLAGEGGFLELDSEHALRELRLELESANPNTGLYREFAAVDVRLAQSPGTAGDGAMSPGDDEASDPTAEGMELDLGRAGGGAEPGPGLAAPHGQPSAAGSGASPARAARSPTSGEQTHTCSWCRAELPRRNHLHFCPFCGADIQLVPCPGCGEELERDWRFCIACGRETTG